MRGAVVPRFSGSRCGRASEGHLTKRHRCNERRCKPACMPPPTATPQPPPTPSHSHPTATPQPTPQPHPSHLPHSHTPPHSHRAPRAPHQCETFSRWCVAADRCRGAVCGGASYHADALKAAPPPPPPPPPPPALCAASVLCCGARSERTGERCAPLVCLTHTAKGQVGTEPALHTRRHVPGR